MTGAGDGAGEVGRDWAGRTWCHVMEFRLDPVGRWEPLRVLVRRAGGVGGGQACFMY